MFHFHSSKRRSSGKGARRKNAGEQRIDPGLVRCLATLAFKRDELGLTADYQRLNIFWQT